MEKAKNFKTEKTDQFTANVDHPVQRPVMQIFGHPYDWSGIWKPSCELVNEKS